MSVEPATDDEVLSVQSQILGHFGHTQFVFTADDVRKLVYRVRAEQAENEQLRKALEPFAYRVPVSKLNSSASNTDLVAIAGQELGSFRRAYATILALSPKEEEQ